MNNIRWTYPIARIWYEATKNTNEFTHHRKKRENTNHHHRQQQMYSISFLLYIYSINGCYSQIVSICTRIMWMEILLIKSFTSGQSLGLFHSFLMAIVWDLSEHTRKLCICVRIFILCVSKLLTWSCEFVLYISIIIIVNGYLQSMSFSTLSRDTVQCQ